MSRIAHFPDLNAVREAAALWVVRLDRGLSATEEAELQQWLATPLHRREFEELGGIWDRVEVLSVLSDVFPRQAPAKPGRARWRVAAAVTALAASAAAVMLVLPQLRTTPPGPDAFVTNVAPLESFATAVGERRAVQLADGSLLSLNTQTLVEVRLDGARRELHLRRGEAHFEVAHDTTRPFIVTAGGHAVRAVGTAFNIRLRTGEDTDVLVTAGAVRVTDGAQGAQAATLEAGQLMELRAGNARIRTLDPASAETQLAWRRGVIIFNGQTLAEAIAEIARYTPRTLRLADPALGRRRIVGYFPTSDTRVLLQSLQANFGLTAMETSTEIVLSAHTDQAAPD